VAEPRGADGRLLRRLQVWMRPGSRRWYVIDREAGRAVAGPFRSSATADHERHRLEPEYPAAGPRR
jgi:hypothetical protein